MPVHMTFSWGRMCAACLFLVAAAPPALAQKPPLPGKKQHRGHSAVVQPKAAAAAQAQPSPAPPPAQAPAAAPAASAVALEPIPAAPAATAASAATGPSRPTDARVEHDVPAAGEEGYEVPIAWTIRDSRLRHRPQVLSVDLGIWPDSLMLGAFWAAPVLPRGFIRHVNDSFDLEFGFLLGAVRSDWMWNDATTTWALWPAFGARWNFFLTHNWMTFVTFKLAGRIGLSGPSPGWFDVIGGAGATYRIKERVHLRLELNYPQGAVVGLSFPIGAL